MTRIGSLCSGYGGLDLAAEALTGGTTVWHCEWEDAPSKVLAARWPGVPNHRDLTTVDWTTVEPVDVLTAGYPCQPFSQAGQRKGSDDVRHLWPHVRDAIGVLRPRLVLLENVAGHLTLGAAAVVGDLAALGYVGSAGTLRASDVGACHGRNRWFLAAHPDGERGHEAVELDGCRAEAVDGAGVPDEPDRVVVRSGPGRWGDYQTAIERHARVVGRPPPEPTQPSPRTGRPQLSPRFVEWMMMLPAGWATDTDLTRNQQLKALGNGVVPAQALTAYRQLLESA